MGEERFQDRRSILRALRDRYQKERVAAIIKKYDVKKSNKKKSKDTNKTDSIKITRVSNSSPYFATNRIRIAV